MRAIAAVHCRLGEWVAFFNLNVCYVNGVVMHVAQLLMVVRRSHSHPLHLTGRIGAILN